MTVRMQDIATDLNLSKMTISKVLRGQMDVSAKTKARVLQRAKELNYRPNISARSLRTGRTRSIGLIVPSLADPHYTSMAGMIVQRLRIANYSVSLSSSEYEAELEKLEIEQHLSSRVDALILTSVQSEAELTELTTNSQIPLIHVHAEARVFKSNAVALGEEEVGHLAASHLLRVGCSKVARVGGARTNQSSSRMAGFRAALAEGGQRVRSELMIEIADESASEYERGVLAVQSLLRCRVRADGVVCETDMVAVGVMDALSAAGVAIPGEMAVIGCGNDARLCEMRIPLSSVELSSVAIGERAAKLALKLLSEEKPTKVRSVVVPPTLVVRASTVRLR